MLNFLRSLFTTDVGSRAIRRRGQAQLALQSLDLRTLPTAGMSAVCGYVYLDANNNGVKDSGESGIGCVTITLTGKDDCGKTVTKTTTTDCNGMYEFTGLKAGKYTITETQPTGYADGKESAIPGVVTSNDKYSCVQLDGKPTKNPTYFNFGERPVCGTPGSNGKGSGGKGSGGKGSGGKGSGGKGSGGKGSGGKGSGGKGSDGKGSDGKGSDGKGSDGKGSDGKGSGGKGSGGKGSNGKCK